MTDFNISEISEKISFCQSMIDQKIAKKNYIEEIIKRNEKDIDELEKQIDRLDKIMILFQKVSEFARIEVKKQVEDLVTKCLSMIFDENINFLIDIKEKRDVSCAEIYIESKINDFNLKSDPINSNGGGIVDVTSLALRVSFLEMLRPNVEGPLILDEPGKHLSDEYVPNLSNFLSYISSGFNRQIIMVTHNNHLSANADMLMSVSITEGESKIDNLSNDSY